MQATLFTRAAWRYWLEVFPCVRSELKHWHNRASQIPDDALRAAALEALQTKRDGLEGAAAFATLVPKGQRIRVACAIVAFQVSLDYLDTVTEMPNPDPVVNGHNLNRALTMAFEPGAAHPDYYARNVRHDDAGYLEELVDTCRTTVASLPSFRAVAAKGRAILSRIVTYQSLNHGGATSRPAFARWAQAQSAPGVDLHWWETAAAAGSQLSVLALIAVAARSAVPWRCAELLEQVYFPWVDALSTLLDSLVDQRTDDVEGQFSLVGYYASSNEAAERLRAIATEAWQRARVLPDADEHMLILAAMTAFFHATAQERAPSVCPATRLVLETAGGLALPALLIFKARGVLVRVARALSAGMRPVHV